MALNTIKNTHGSPYVARTFAPGAVRVLHAADAPTGCKHLPAGVLLQPSAGAANFVFLDADGVTNTITFGAAFPAALWLPIGPAELTAANGFAVTVFWFRGTKDC